MCTFPIVHYVIGPNGEHIVLPRELVIEIISRLPVSSLVRFMLVCKSWYSFIKSSYFTMMHMNRMDRKYLLCLGGFSFSILCDKKFIFHSTIDHPFRDLHGSVTVAIVCSCNGLLCLTQRDPHIYGRQLYLCNPLIRKFKSIANSGFYNLFHDPKKLSLVIGFGFDKTTNDYKIVRIVYLNTHGSAKEPQLAEVYSLRSDCWRRIQSEVPIYVNHQSVFSNGTVNWLGAKTSKHHESILSFDLKDEAFKEIVLPAYWSAYWSGISNLSAQLMEHNGLLCLFVYEEGTRNCCWIWVMREHGVPDSWTKQFSVHPFKEQLQFPIGFTKSGKFFYEDIVKQLISYDIEKQECDDFSATGYEDVVTDFLESLILLEDKTSSFDLRQ